jgi:hypothetical protein
MSEEIIESVFTDFPDAVYYPKFRLMTWHPIGIFNRALADNVLQFIEWEEYIQEAPFDRYMDLSGITEVQINLQHLSEAARRRRSVLQPVRSAIFADKTDSFVIAQIYESLMENAVAITVRSFRERDLAAQWLDVPVVILGPTRRA